LEWNRVSTWFDYRKSAESDQFRRSLAVLEAYKDGKIVQSRYADRDKHFYLMLTTNYCNEDGEEHYGETATADVNQRLRDQLPLSSVDD
jgi:hypothetical protein